MTPKAVLLKWIYEFNKHNPIGLGNLYEEEAEFLQMAGGGLAKGKSKIISGFEKFFNSFPDAWAKDLNVMEDREWAAWEWLGGGTFAREFRGFLPTGEAFELRGCGFMNIKKGRIILHREYWDKETWYSQLTN